MQGGCKWTSTPAYKAQKKGRIEAEQDRAAKRLIELRDIVARDAANSSLEQQDLFNRANTLLGIPPDIVDGTSIHVLGPHPLTIGMSPEFLATIRSMRESIDTASAVLTTELDLPAGLKAVIGNNLGYKGAQQPSTLLTQSIASSHYKCNFAIEA